MEAVLVGDLPVHAVIVICESLRLGDVDQRLGKGCVLDCTVASIWAYHVLDLEAYDFGNAQAVSFAGNLVIDRDGSYSQHLPYERREPRRSSSLFSSKYLPQGVRLALVCRRIEVQCRFPFHLLHVARRICRQGNSQPVKFGIPKLPLVYVPRSQKSTVTAGWRAQKYARASNFAVTCFKVIPFSSHFVSSRHVELVRI